MLRLQHVTFSCEDPARVAEFWAALLGYERAPAGASWIATDPHEEDVRLLFNKMAKSETIDVPIHLDINVPDREAELARVLQLGGSLVETKSYEIGELSDTTTIMRDPEGNGFCLEGLPNTKRAHIWNITFACAEPRPLGRFWAFALDWPGEDIDESILQKFRDAGVGEPELSGFHLVKAPNGGRPRFYFHRREKSRPESYPIHLDFAADDREAEIERLVQAGASVVETKQGTNLTFTVLRDPEGNPFCVG
ncbi:MAG: VOC family protein [Actinobacteria bacterium]|nr:VOC family protein [Actinomycetota bacterium]